MLIKLFDFEGGKLVPTVHCYSLSFLKDIMDKYPDNHIKIFEYLQYMCSWNPVDNPFLAMKEEDREEAILEEIKPDFSTEDTLIQVALDKCNRMMQLPSARLWLRGKQMLDKVDKFLEVTTLTTGKDGSIKDVLATYKEFNKLNEEYNRGYKAFIDDIKTSIRGDKFISQV